METKQKITRDMMHMIRGNEAKIGFIGIILMVAIRLAI